MHPSRSRLIAALAAAAAATLTGCSLGSPASPSATGVATNPPAGGSTGTMTASPAASGSAGAQTSGERTVLIQDGLRIHSSASLSAAVEGTAAWGVTLTVVGYDASGGPWPDSSSPGGWYQVEGSTVTGWIVADPTYTAFGLLSSIGFQDKQIDGVLYPTDWTYSDNNGEVIFEPQTGTDLPTLVIREATTLSALGPAGLTGYPSVSSNSEVVACGYTGTLVKYAAGSGTSAQPTTDPGGGAVDRLPFFVQFRVEVTSQFWLDIEMNYSTEDQLTVFDNAYNSIEFPYPECQQPASASPSAAS